MTENHRGLIVQLDDGVGEEEAGAIAAAIGLLKGVVSVRTAESDPDLELTREHVNAEWRERIVGLLDDEGV